MLQSASKDGEDLCVEWICCNLQVAKVGCPLQDLHMKASSRLKGWNVNFAHIQMKMSHRDKNKGVVFPSKLAKLHGRDWVVHLEAVHHVLVVEDEEVRAGECHCNEAESTTWDFHLLDATNCGRQLLLPHSLPLCHTEWVCGV